jgi:hypothetical protein
MTRFLFILFLIHFGLIHSQTFSSFTTTGTQAQYVPVSFRSVTGDGGNKTFFISRPSIHEGRDWLAHGIVSITGIGNGWGSRGNGLRVDNFSFGFETSSSTSKEIGFVGRILAANANNDIIVYLRGGTLYYYTGAEIISNTGSYQDAAGLSLSTVSINDPLYNLPKGIYYGSFDINAKTSNFSVLDNGNMGLGVSNPTNKLDVNGMVHAKEVKVDLQNWPDYVFENGYKLNSLDEIEKYIMQKGHLPNIPSAEEVAEKGINLGEMNAKLLEKIEELTLYSIEQNKKITSQDQQLKQLQEENRALKSQSAKIEKLEQQVQQLLSTKK